MKKIFACTFLFGLCSLSVFADAPAAATPAEDYDWSTVVENIMEGKQCKKQNRDKTIVGGCSNPDGSLRKGECTEDELNDRDKHNGAATKGKCIRVKKSSSDTTFHNTCAATKCKEGYSLWLGWDSSAEKWVSMGLCRDGKTCKCGQCGAGGKCVPVLDLNLYVDVYNEIYTKYGKDGQEAFYNKCMCEYDLGIIKIPTIPVISGRCDQFAAGTPEKKCCDQNLEVGTDAFKCCIYKENGHRVKWEDNACKCEQGDWNETKKICECTIKVEADLEYICSDTSNTTIHLTKSDNLKVPIPAGVDENCQEIKNVVANSVRSISQTIKSLKKMCEYLNSGSVSSVSSSSGISSLDNWIKTADASRSKWKDASGNFNGSRLASDLTAGVVLGTVGGVVSGVVIKKKQVEKGFDALNCYVGGQKMADWGDEFRIEYFRQ